jgi:hypothetical protein
MNNEKIIDLLEHTNVLLLLIWVMVFLIFLLIIFTSKK